MSDFFENFLRETAHEKAHEIENEKASGNDRKHNNKTILSEEGEFKELSCEWDEEGAGHNANNHKNQNCAPEIERLGNPVDKIKVDSKSNKDRGGGKFKAREILVVRNNGKSKHTD